MAQKRRSTFAIYRGFIENYRVFQKNVDTTFFRVLTGLLTDVLTEKIVDFQGFEGICQHVNIYF